jgi:peptide/nickel transport system substrate-binding protein
MNRAVRAALIVATLGLVACGGESSETSDSGTGAPGSTASNPDTEASSPGQAGSAGGEVLRIGTVLGPRSADPIGTIDAGVFMIQVGDVLEPLTKLERTDDGGLDWVPLLATSWEQVEPTKWRFELREGVTFHDGSDFTSDDVVFTFDKATADDAEVGAILGTIDHAEKVSDYVVDIVTTEPNPLLPRFLFRTGIQPEGWGVDNVEEAQSTAIGTGPYRLVSTTPDFTVLEKSDKYWGDNADVIDRLEFRAIPEAGARFAALQSGEIDVAVSLPPELASQAPKNLEGSGGDVRVARINTGNPALADAEVRRALNMAIDRQSIIDGIQGGAADPANGQVIPSAAFGYNTELTDFEYDPDEARRILEEKGVAGTHLTFMCNNQLGTVTVDSCNTIQQNMNDVGMDVELQIADQDTWIQSGLLAPKNGVTPPDFFLLDSSSETFTAGLLIPRWFMCGTDRSTYCNPQLDEKILAAQREPSAEVAETAWFEIAEELRDESPMLWVVARRARVSVADNVEAPLYPLFEDGDVYWSEWRKS